MVATDEIMLRTGLAGQSGRRRGTCVASAAVAMGPVAVAYLCAETRSWPRMCRKPPAAKSLMPAWHNYIPQR